MFKKLRRRGKLATKYQVSCTVLRLDHIPTTVSQVKVLIGRNNKDVSTSFVPVAHCKRLSQRPYCWSSRCFGRLNAVPCSPRYLLCVIDGDPNQELCAGLTQLPLGLQVPHFSTKALRPQRQFTVMLTRDTLSRR